MSCRMMSWGGGELTPRKAFHESPGTVLSVSVGDGNTLAVPNNFGSSLSFNAPAPTLGKLDERTTSFPPIGAYRLLVSIATRETAETYE